MRKLPSEKPAPEKLTFELARQVLDATVNFVRSSPPMPMASSVDCTLLRVLFEAASTKLHKAAGAPPGFSSRETSAEALAPVESVTTTCSTASPNAPVAATVTAAAAALFKVRGVPDTCVQA